MMTVPAPVNLEQFVEQALDQATRNGNLPSQPAAIAGVIRLLSAHAGRPMNASEKSAIEITTTFAWNRRQLAQRTESIDVAARLHRPGRMFG